MVYDICRYKPYRPIEQTSATGASEIPLVPIDVCGQREANTDLFQKPIMKKKVNDLTDNFSYQLIPSDNILEKRVK